MIKRSLFISLVFVGTSSIMSCLPSKNETNNVESISISSKMGVVRIPIKPKNVVVFDMGTLETFKDLSLPVSGIPKDFVATQVLQYKTDPNIKDAGSIIQPNFELVSAISPDLIIISDVIASEYDKLSQIAPTLYMGLNNEHFTKSVIENMNIIGKIYDITDKTAYKSKQIREKIINAKNIIKTSSSRAMILMYNSGTFSSFGSKSRYAFVFNDLGAKSADKNIERSAHGTIVSNEFISKMNPDILYIIDRNSIMEGVATNKREIENALIKRTNAYKKHNIHYLDPNVWYISGGGTYSVNKMIDDILQGYK